MQPLHRAEELVAGDRQRRHLRDEGRIVFTTRFSTGKIRSMYQFMISGRDSSRSVSAVGAQSTTSRSAVPSSTCRLTSMRPKISSRPGMTDSSSA